MEEQSLYGIPLNDIKSKTEYENGTYYTTSSYAFYVPNDVNDATNAFIYYPGSGGSGNDAAALREMISAGGPNQIIVIANDAYTDKRDGGTRHLQLIQNIGLENSADITSIDTMGFSASGPTTFNTVLNLAKTYPDDGPHNAVFCDVVNFSVSQEQIDILLEDESSLLFLEPNNNITSFEKELAQNGVDVVLAWTTGSHAGHVPLNREALANGIIDFVTGESDELANKEIYKFMAYDIQNSKWYEIPFEDVVEKFASDSGVGLYRYYEKLSNLTDLQSSNSFIQSEINAIRNAIKNTNFLSNMTGTFYDSTTNIPNAEADLVQTYFATCSKLLNFLEKDTVKIVEIGELIQSTGDELAVEASELNNVTSADTTSNTADYYSDNSNSSTSNNNSSTSSWVTGTASALGSVTSSNSSTHATYSYGVGPGGTTVYSNTSTNSSNTTNTNNNFSSNNLTSSDYEVEAGGVYNYDGIEKHLETVDGVTVELPDGLGSVHSYMGWQCITAKSSNQYKLREAAGMNFDDEGFAKIGDRYVVAVTSTFGNVGDYIDVYQEDGSVIQCVIGDIKSQGDAGCTQWGHNNGQCVVEFVVDKSSWYGDRMHTNPGTSQCHPEWNQNITKIVNKGNFFELIQTDAAKLDEVVV